MVMKNCRFKKNGTVLELMAGCGRNMDVLLPYFANYEMLERNNSMTTAIKNLSNKPNAVYEQDVRDFRWEQKLQCYACIFCIWGLGYLTRADNMHMLDGIKRAIKPNGFIIFFESVISNGETKDRFHDTFKQQNVVRRSGYYNELSSKLG
jgi:phospholipid N-methyltransferase